MSEECTENPERIKIDTSLIEARNKMNLKELVHPKEDENSTLLILNQKIDIPKPLFYKIWKLHDLKVCADGAANRLYDYLNDDESIRTKYLPDYIIGDLDSLSEKIFNYYRKNKVIIIKQTTQYSTDFTKCVNLISLHFNSPKFRASISNENNIQSNHGIELEKGIHTLYNSMTESLVFSKVTPISLLALGGIGGRFDQTIHSITQLYTLSENASYFKLCYMTPTDLIFLVNKNGTLIEYDPHFRNTCVGNCGLLPIGEPTVINETRGLKWDVKNWATSVVNGRVSSSNRFVGENCCYINTKHDIILNVEIFVDKLIDFL
ncbi:thi80p [Saccharomyces arboricola H-6]|uniref:Thiamine pyrophosphokinase n=1 Tax=Saccharomyces arboricola (strain H-6 / AS 2.3317 / CBS 10644) TaxID=1160507 RepID=J8PHU8_SACAR|nr:thi80p [Saccharomyces arboricola H-6]